MLLSIIVPVYNVAQYLERCIESLRTDSSAFDYEILLVDDGSRDNSGAICDAYSQKYSNIRVLHKSNGGLSDARNYGLAHAEGDYIVFVDSDDYVEPGSASKICEIIADGACDIYCSDYYSLTAGEETDIKYAPADTVMSGAEFFKYQLQQRSMVSSVVQNIYRTEFLRENRLYFKKGIYHEDEEWTPRVFMAAQKVQHVDLVYYAYIIRENSIMQQKDFSKHMMDFTATMQSLLQIYAELPDRELYALLKDNLVDKYLSIYARGQFGRRGKHFVMPMSFLKKDLVNRKTKLKLLIFGINKTIFCKISQIYNRGR